MATNTVYPSDMTREDQLLLEQTPKTVLFAIAKHLAAVTHGGGYRASIKSGAYRGRIMAEWQSLYNNQIVRQKPPKKLWPTLRRRNAMEEAKRKQNDAKPTQPTKYEVVPHKFYRRDDGATASLHGAVPWTSDTDKPRWQVVEQGFTLYNPLTNQYGIGRAPFPTREEAQTYADTHKPSRIGIGD